ncbi:nucleoside deaminase [Metabacillus arenae]|uniref:Nucleoside deaminase n=1 Tax=Metabacillus arenae TaxID=2771434 RepID=A0A926NHS0_9BACI|nr:nucleoside deaminase [Metabacillus arenae]MBD1381864.1 nucleoside deaminase [Metabacillus arenae]
MNHEQYMTQAIDLAYENVIKDGGPFAAIVVKDEVIVGQGVNLVTKNNDPTAHAEVMAIRDACKNLGTFQLDQCILYTSCEPCPMCLGAIYWARPKAVYYAMNKHEAAQIGFDDAFIYEEIAQVKEKRKIPFIHIKTDDKRPFVGWKNKEDKIEY